MTRVMTALVRQIPRIIGVLLLLVLLLLRAADPFFIDNLRERTFDAYQRISPRELPKEGNRHVVIATVDEASLVKYGAWPWSRKKFAELTNKLRTMGAHTVAYDVVFSEPRDSEGDAAFAASLENIQSVLGMGAYWKEVETAAVDRYRLTPRVLFPSFHPANSKQWARIFPNPKTLLRNIPIIENAALGHGIFHMRAGVDGVTRSAPTTFLIDNRLYPSFALEVLRVSFRAPHSKLRADPGGVNAVGIGHNSLIAPTDRRGNIWPYFTKFSSDRYISIRKIMEGEVARHQIQGKIVLVGATAIGLGDHSPSPLYANVPGVEFHAQVIESVLLKKVLKRPNYVISYEVGLLVLGGVLLIIFVPKLSGRGAVVSILVSIGGVIGLSWYLFSTRLFLFDASLPVLTAILLHFLFLTTKSLRRENE
jgi:adenylate cyclase